MKSTWKRLLALLLVLTLCAGLFPGMALAEETEEEEPSPTEEPMPEEELQEEKLPGETPAEEERVPEDETADPQDGDEPLPIEQDEYGNYVIYSFAELKQVIRQVEEQGLAQNGNKLLVYYRGEEEFVFEESIELPDWLYLTIPGPYGAQRTPNIRIPQTVIVTNNFWLGGNGNASDGDLRIEGTLVNNRSGNANGGNIIVTGRLVNKGQVYARGGTLIGADKIVRDGESAYFAKFAYINDSDADLLISALEDTSDYGWADNVGVQLRTDGQAVSLNRDVTAPSKTSLYVMSPLTVETGAVLTVMNAMTLRAAMTVNGELRNEGDIWLYSSADQVYPYGGKISLGEDGAYEGAGRLIVSGAAPGYCLPGFDLSRFQISDWGVDGKVLKLIPQLPITGSCGENLTYTLGEDGILTISGTGAMKDFEWGAAPWYELRDLVTGLRLEPGVTRIGEMAFMQLTNVRNAAIPEGVTGIGPRAFFGCSGLTDISFPQTLQYVDSYAFSGCSLLGELEFSDGLQWIGDAAFSNCGFLESVRLPGSLNEVGGELFFNCPNLKDLYFAGTMARWQELAPSAVDRYTVTVHCSDGDIRPVDRSKCGDSLSWALDDTGTLTVTGTGSMWDFADGSGPWSDKSEQIRALVLKEGVSSISSGAFSGCTSLETVSIPDSLRQAGDYAFLECVSLQSIALPGVRTLGFGVFSGCADLWEVKLGEGLSEMGPLLFENCMNLERVEIPAGVTAIGWNCFAQSGLREIVFTGRAPSFNGNPFGTRDVTVFYPQGDPSWSAELRASFGGSVTWISYEAQSNLPFGFCGDNLTWELSEDGTLTISGTGDMWEHPAWDIGEVKKLVVEEGVASIAAKAFAGCGKLKEIRFRCQAPQIGENAFAKVTAKAYYPKEYASWTSAVRKNYGGKLTWTAYNLYPKTTSVSIINRDYYDVTGKSMTVDLNAPGAADPIWLRAAMNPEGAYQKASWTVSDAKGTYCKWTVNDDGSITLVPSGNGKTGSVTVTAKAADGSGKTGKLTVKFVKLAQHLAIRDGWPTELRSGAKYTFKTDIADDKTLTDKAVLWSVSDPAAAKISSGGALTAKKVTEPTTITVTATVKANPSVTATAELTIHPPVTAARISYKGIVQTKGQIVDVNLDGETTIRLEGSTLPENAIQRGTWKSSAPKVARVDENGNVTGLKAGTATITFTAADGSGKSTTVKVRVGKWTASITLGEHGDSLVSGKSMTVKAASLTVDGQTPTNKKLQWVSSNPDAAKVSKGKITAKTVYKNTDVTIWAIATDGSGVAAGFTLTIKPKTREVLLVTEAGAPMNAQTLKIKYGSASYMSFGSELYDSDTDSSSYPEVKWKSSAPKVARVDSYGNVEILRTGTAKITVTMGKLSATVTLKIVK